MLNMFQLPQESRSRGRKSPGNKKNGEEEIRDKGPRKSLACVPVPDLRCLPRSHFVAVVGFKDTPKNSPFRKRVLELFFSAYNHDPSKGGGGTHLPQHHLPPLFFDVLPTSAT